MAIYMKYGDIKGSVTTEGFKDWIELNSLQFGIGRGIGSPTGSDKTREASAPSISEITVTKMMDESTGKLVTDAWAGEMNSKVEIKLTTTTKDKTEAYLTYELKNTGLSGYSVSSGGDRPQESLSLNFTAINIKWMDRDSGGKAQPSVIGYDLSQMKKTA